MSGNETDCAEYLALCGWLTRPRGEYGIRLADEEQGWVRRGYDELAEQAHTLAARLRDAGLAHGDGVCLVLPTDFVCVTTMFAAWSAGASVTLVTPPGFGGGDDYVEHLAAVLRQAGPRLLVTAPELEPVAGRAMAAAAMPGSPVLVDESPATGPGPGDAMRAPIRGTDAALVQFTSGSSGTPKGVRISWRNLAANIGYILESVGWRDGDTTASWLPLYHDMGLIGGLLTTISQQGELYLMRPDQFIRDPQRWLAAMARAQHSVAPSFGLGYTARRVDPAEIADLDLSGLRSLIVGAEPIDTDHVHAFTELLGATGYDPDCLRPAYGMAEVTLMATIAQSGSTPVAVRIDRTTLRFGAPVTIGDSVEYRGQALTGGGWMIGLGGSTPHSTVRIVDGDGRPMPDGVPGEIVIGGPSVAEGYHRGDPAAPADTAGTEFRDGEMWSGDAGFVHDGILYVLGRMGTSIKVRGKSVFMEDIDALLARETGLPKQKLAAVARQDAGVAGIVLFAEHPDGPWIDTARAALRAELGPAAGVTVVTGPRGLIRRTSSGKPRRRVMWELFGTDELDPAVAVHHAGSPLTARPEHVIADRRAGSALLSDNDIAELLDAALATVEVRADSTILLEGSIAEGFGNEGSDIDFLVVSPGDDPTPEMPTVLFLGGRRVEVRTRSEAQVRAQQEYVQKALIDEDVDRSHLIDLNQDVLNRTQRFGRAVIVRPGDADIESLRQVLPYADLSRVLAGWWRVRARESLRQAVALSTLHQGEEALDWARDGLLQTVKGWVAERGETYLETKWTGPQLDRLGQASVTERYLDHDRALRRGEGTVTDTLALAAELGVTVDEDASQVVLSRVQGVTSWPIDGRIHVLRDGLEVFVLSDRAARAWRTVVFGRPVPEIVQRWDRPLHDELAEFVRLGLVGLRWGRRSAIRPAVAMVKPHRPCTPPPSTATPVLGIGGGARDTDTAVTPNPLPARRFAECAAALVWSNVIVENAREDLVGALSQDQARVAEAAADRLIKGAVRLLLCTVGVSPLPPDVAVVATLDRFLPRGIDGREALLRQARAVQAVTFDGPDDAESGLAVLDEFVDTVRATADLRFPASFDSHEQWRRTLTIAYDWLRLAAYLDTDLPIDEVQDLLTSGGAQPHQRDTDTHGKAHR